MGARYWTGILLMTCAVAAYGTEQAPSKQASKKAPPDLDFLEYLGTLENGEDNWTDVVNVELPQANGSAGKSAPAAPAKGNSKTETATKSAGNEK